MTDSLTRAAWRLTLLLASIALVVAVACDTGEDDADETSSPTPTETQDGTPAATSTVGGGGTASGTAEPGEPGTQDGTDGAAQAAYSEALQLALDDEIGQEAPQDLLAEWNIDVTPDGEGLPEGSGTAEQGAQIYAAECAACHGPQGEGGIGPRLVSEEPGPWEPGDSKTIGSYWPYATTVYDYIRRAMPFFEPGTLSDEEVYALTAYLLAENEIIEPDEVMDQDTLPQVEMPARDLFNPCWPDLCYDEYGRDGGGDADADAAGTATGTPAGTATAEATATPSPDGSE